MPSLPSKLGISSSPTLTLAPSYVSLAELLPTPVYATHTKLPLPPPTSPSPNRLCLPPTSPSPNRLYPLLRLPHRLRPHLFHVSPTEPSPASRLRLSHRTSSAPSYISLTEPSPASRLRLSHRTPSPPLPRLPHRTAPTSTQLLSTRLPLDRSCPAPIPLVPSPPEPMHDLVRTPVFGSSGVLFHIPGSLSPSLKILRIIPKRQTYKRALQRIHLERTYVHACILSCTRVYTTVYPRVYSSLLGRRYSLGISRLGHGYFYLRHILRHDLALTL